MGRYIADQNKVVLMHESGTYASTSGNGYWIGEVTEHSIDDAENKIEDRYLGRASRNFGDFSQGPRDVTGTLTYNAQDFRIAFWSIGSTYDTSGTTSYHTATEIDTDSQLSAYTSGTLNPPMSFTLEDSKQTPGTGANFTRTIKGVVPNTVSINANQGEKVTITADYIGQTIEFGSGTTTSVTEETITPYLWSSVSLTAGGNNLSTAKSVSLEINNNMEAPHYLNGSRDISVPFPQGREYTMSVTMDLTSDNAKTLYETYYKNNTTFNAVLDLNQDSTGSQHATFTMSGCYITAMENPSTMEGLTESTVEIRPQTVSAEEWTSTANAALFNPW